MGNYNVHDTKQEIKAMNQYHVFPVTGYRTDNIETKIIQHQGHLYGVVKSDGVATGCCGDDELAVLEDARPGARFSVQRASNYEKALQQALAAKAID